MSQLSSESEGFFKEAISREQCKDTGLALILILSIIGYFTGNILFFKISIPVLVVTMTIPQWFHPLAVVWFAFSKLLGSIMSKIILTMVFYLIVVPVAFIRKLLKVDNLKLTQFHKSTESVMIERNHVYDRSDIENPY
ncbi:MAG TPA: SxtJ family membrane protein [Lentimicrobium sp.]|nr:SxtJ family membrane protein [Lentimicrobium sp.]